MSDETGIERTEQSSPVTGDAIPVEIEKLPVEMKAMVSVMAGLFRSTSGLDPESAKVLAQTEMHEETCKLQGFTESLKVRDQQNARDHEYRQKRLNHESAKSMIVLVVCLGGIVSGLYLIVAEHNSAVGTPLLVAAFMAMLGGKSILPKDKE